MALRHPNLSLCLLLPCLLAVRTLQQYVASLNLNFLASGMGSLHIL